MHRGLRHRGVVAGAAIISAAFIVVAMAAASANAQRQSPHSQLPSVPSTSSTSSTSTTVETTTTTLPALDARAFAGNWGHHGVWMTINAYGTGHADWRIYKWCTDDPIPPCDAVEGNEIVDGGHADFRIVAAEGEQATAVVAGSTEPGAWADGETTLTLIPDHGLRVSTFLFTDFCGEHHWSTERCGA